MLFRNLRVQYRHSQLTVALRESRLSSIHHHLSQTLILLTDNQYASLVSRMLGLEEVSVRRLASVITVRRKPQFLGAWIAIRRTLDRDLVARRRAFTAWLTELRLLGVTLNDRAYRLRLTLYQTLCDYIKLVI